MLPDNNQDQKMDILRIVLWDDASVRLQAITKNIEETQRLLTEIATHMVKVPESP